MKSWFGYLITLIIAVCAALIILFQPQISRAIEMYIPQGIFQKTFTIESFNKDIDLLEWRVSNTYDALALEQQLGQLFMPAVGNNGLPFETVKLWAEDGIISGFMVLGADVTDQQIQQLRSLIKESTGIPPLVALDAEPSLMSSRVEESQFGATEDYNSVTLSSDVATEISRILTSKGYNVNFAPVYDTNANNSVIGSRSHGSTPQATAVLANAFARSSLDAGIAPTAKHFPGHGQVAGDSHLLLPTIRGELSELPAFESAIQNDVPLMMIGHLAVENDQWGTSGLPATLSPVIMKDLLREELGFQGIVITDAFNMSALDGFENKELESIKAGADIVLMPEENIMTLIDLLYEEIQLDQALEKEVEEKIKRVLEIRHTLR